MTELQVNKQIAKGAIWMVALRFSVKGISIVSTIILARLLTPDDFGLMALAMSVYALIELIRAFGFGTALIQNQNAGRDHYDTAWTMQIIFALFASGTIVAVSDISAEFYGDLRLADILRVMGVIFLISAFTNIGIVNFHKEMTFNKDFLFQILIKLSGFCVTIPLAYYLRSYWALLMGIVAGRMATLILSYIMHSYRPRICLKTWRELMSFTSWLMVNNILTFINNHSQNFILGKLAGTGVLGLYSISDEIATITTNEIVAPINRAAYPGYSKIAKDKKKLKQTYLTILSHIILIALPSAIGIAAITPIFVPILLGEKWLDTIPIIQIIALASVLISINTNSVYVYLALAKQKLTTKLMCLRLVIYLPLLYQLALQQGAYGAALATLIAAGIMFPASQLLLKRELAIGWVDILSILYRPVMAVTIMGACVYQYVINLEQYLVGLDGILYLAQGVLIGVFSFTVSLVLIWWITGKKPGSERWVLELLKQKLGFKLLR